jgi:hypothetical protein
MRLLKLECSIVRPDLVRSWKDSDLQELQSSDERAEGTYLPQEAEMEMPNMRKGQDAETGVNSSENLGRQSRSAHLITGNVCDTVW